jgi:hypothetical protein
MAGATLSTLNSVNEEQSLDLVRISITAMVGLRVSGCITWVTITDSYLAAQPYPLASVRTHATSGIWENELLRFEYSKVFPGMLYNFRALDAADPSTSYDMFMNGRKPSDFDLTDGVSLWSIIPRNQHPGADKLLDRLVSQTTDFRKFWVEY